MARRSEDDKTNGCTAMTQGQEGHLPRGREAAEERRRQWVGIGDLLPGQPLLGADPEGLRTGQVHICGHAGVDGVLASTHAVGGHEIEGVTIGACGVDEGKIGPEGGEKTPADGESHRITVGDVAQHPQVGDEWCAIQREVLGASDVSQSCFIRAHTDHSDPAG